MQKRLNYILIMILFLVVYTTARGQSVIDKVCKGAVRTYRVDGEPGLAYTWILADHTGNSVSVSPGNPFSYTDSSGNPVIGSEIEIKWSFDPEIYTLSVEKQSLYKCTTDTAGIIEVIPVPVIDAGKDATVCEGDIITLSDAVALDVTASGIEWTTGGDGTFNDPLAVNPVYTPGPKDILAQTVTLKLTAKSLDDDEDGCLQEDEVEITINPQSKLVITDPPEACEPDVVNLTAASVTAGSTVPAAGSFSYWKDAAATIPQPNPALITASGTYYIKLDVNGNCPDIKAVRVTVKPQAKLVITNPPAVCEPATVDISAAYITAGSDPGTLSYWANASATLPLTNYSSISASGIYYIKSTNSSDCPDVIRPVTVVINQGTTPQFNLPYLLCLNSAPPPLPAISTNNITGTWSPSVISTATVGKTTYAFTPDPGQCAVKLPLEMEITDNIIPVFAAIGPFCLNSTAPLLPEKSLNEITGTWSPSSISTATAGNAIYTFTPNPGQCANNPIPVTVTINPIITPTFAPIGSVCQNAPNPLPNVSTEGISGTWSPAFSSATVGSATYTFNPNNGECALPVPLSITIEPSGMPLFDKIGPLCVNSVPPTLPPTSINGISGTWSPATISTAAIGPSSYLFTPDNSGTCGNPVPILVEVIGISLTYTKVDLGESTSPIGSIDLTVSGGSGDYSYSWKGPNGFVSNTQDINGLAIGDYSVVVTDNVTNCSGSETINISSNFVVDYSFNPVSCFGRSDGNATAIVKGGTTPYYYTWWRSGQVISTDKIATGLIAGSYSLTVTDSKGLSNIKPIEFVITQPEKITITVSKSDISCFGKNDGEISVSVSGGTPGYDIWMNGLKVTALKGLSPGEYLIQVTDDHSCTKDTVVKIEDPPLMTVKAKGINGVCFGVSGVIQFSFTNVADGNYNILYDGGQFSNVPISGNKAIIPVPEGIYSNFKLVAGGCSIADNTSITIKDPPELILAAKVSAQPGCLVPTGTIEVTSPLGNNYQYSKDGGLNYQTSPTFTGLIAGSSHVIKVKDTPTGCESAGTPLTIDPMPLNPAAPAVAEIAPSCYVPSGSVQVNSPLGSNYQYSIDGGTYQSSPIFANLLPGSNHTIKVIDTTTGCESLGTPVTISAMPPIPSSPVAVVTLNPTCNNPDGTVVVTDPKEGTGFEYSIDGGAYQASATFSGLKWGNHFVNVRNIVTGCVSSPATNITVKAVPPPPILMATAQNPLCFGDPGSIIFKLENTPDGKYTIKYTDGEFSNVTVFGGTATVTTPAGTYNDLTIEVNGCTSGEDVDRLITEPAELVITADVTEIDLKSGRKGAINLTITGGTPFSGINPYLIKWSTGQTTLNIKDLNEGIYTVLVTDKNGCTAQKSITIPKPNFPPIALDDEFNAGCEGVFGILTTNDSDPENDPFFMDTTPVKPPTHGVLTLNPNGSFEYKASPGYTGTDSFRYAIYDANHYQGDTATVLIHIVADFDGDGVADEFDPDADGDGILNLDEGTLASDTDGDGHLNWLDVDADNDGIVDNIETQTSTGYIAPTGLDTDKDGLDDAYDTDQGGTVIKPVDSDLTLAEPDRIPDFLDADSDNDRVPDYIEGHDLNADGRPDRMISGNDSDADGLDNAYDDLVNGCNNLNATGAIASLQDFDGDGMKDWRDENDDNDEYLTRFEDLNVDGDYSNDDMDFDGHPEYLDYGRDCDLFIPDAFSPNNDNIHDYFQIYCINHFPNAKMYIFDQLGNKLFEKDHYGNIDFWGTADKAWWDGTTSSRSASVNGKKVIPGTYYYVLRLGNGEVKKSFVFVSY